MPPKSKRVNLTLDGPMLAMLEKEAEFSRRGLATQVLIDLEKHFLEKQRELDYYRPTQLNEERRSDEPQFFQAPEKTITPSFEDLQKLKERLGRDKT